MREGTAAESVRDGRCLCGSVTFRTSGPLRAVVFCHCAECRRQSGYAYAATSVLDEALAVSGDGLTWYAASGEAKRGFCSRCGTLLFWKHKDRAETSILAGAFDQPSGLVPSHHIFVGEKADFYEIGDGLPQFVGNHGGQQVARKV